MIDSCVGGWSRCMACAAGTCYWSEWRCNGACSGTWSMLLLLWGGDAGMRGDGGGCVAAVRETDVALIGWQTCAWVCWWSREWNHMSIMSLAHRHSLSLSLCLCVLRVVGRPAVPAMCNLPLTDWPTVWWQYCSNRSYLPVLSLCPPSLPPSLPQWLTVSDIQAPHHAGACVCAITAASG